MAVRVAALEHASCAGSCRSMAVGRRPATEGQGGGRVIPVIGGTDGGDNHVTLVALDRCRQYVRSQVTLVGTDAGIGGCRLCHAGVGTLAVITRGNESRGVVGQVIG